MMEKYQVISCSFLCQQSHHWNNNKKKNPNQ